MVIHYAFRSGSRLLPFSRYWWRDYRLVEFVDGMPDGKYSISDKAALYCIGKVNEEAIAKTGAGVPAYITEAFMRTGSYDCPKQYQDVIKTV